MKMNLTEKLRLREIGRYPGILVNKLLHLQSWEEMDNSTLSPSYATKFCLRDGYEKWIAIAFEDGQVGIGNMDGNLKTIQSNYLSQIGLALGLIHKNAIYDLDWLPSTSTLVTACGDQTSKLVDVGADVPRIVRVFTGHTASVRRVGANPSGDQEFISGSRDGRIIVWDVRCSKSADVLDRCHQSPAAYSSSVLDVKYMDDHRIVSCGNADGNMKVWDLRKTHCVRRNPSPLHTIHVPIDGRMFVELAVQPGGQYLYATTTYGQLIRYGCWDQLPCAAYIGFSIGVDCRFCVSPDGEYVCTGNEYNHAAIWPTAIDKTVLVSPLLSLKTHADKITSVTWSRHREPLIVTGSDDLSQRVWRVPHHLGSYNNAYTAYGVALPDPDCYTKCDVPQVSFCAFDYYNLRFKKKMPALAWYNTPLPLAANAGVNAQPNLYVTPRKLAADINQAPSTSATRQALSPVKGSGPSGNTPNPDSGKGGRKLFGDDADTVPSFRPTSYYLKNLPNSMLDTPFSPIAGPSSSVDTPVLKENVDWLTEMGRKNASGSESKHTPSVKKPSVKKSAQRSSGNSKTRKPVCTLKIKGKSLLQYFTSKPKLLGDANSDSSDFST